VSAIALLQSATERVVESVAACDPDLSTAALGEAAELAAAIANGVPGAVADWKQAFPRSPQAFDLAAEVGADFLSRPTPTLARVGALNAGAAVAYAHALADVASAACSLGEPNLDVISRAAVAAATQLRAAGVARPTQAADVHLDAALDTSPVPAAGPTATAATALAATAVPDVAVAKDEVPAPKTLPELLADLDALTGLERVKSQVRRQTNMLRANRLRVAKGLHTLDVAQHLVFTGNPGTGKSTVARLIIQIYRALGILSKGQLVETDRAGLVAGYEGQTAIKTTTIATSALGGGLFIDEAYSLLRNDNDAFGHEAIDTLVKLMEDHRDDLVVIVAGYPVEMDDFIASNPGLKSRFALTIVFDDYSDDELVAIFCQMAQQSDYTVSPAVIERFRTRLAGETRDRGFGNGRFVRNVFEAAAVSLSNRIADIADPTEAQLCEIEPADLDAAAKLER
jgi:Holliday junction resolvasome RuvABC ATP-dependent DNA helicase subunit